MEIKEIKLKDLVTNSVQPEWRTEERQLKDLLHSIKSIGLMEPISVRQINGNGKYEIINGHRRAECCNILQWGSIPAVVNNSVDSIEGFIACNTSSKQIRRKDYVGIYLKGGTPPRRVMNDLIIIVDVLGKDFIPEIMRLDLSAEVITNYITMAEALEINNKKEIKNFIRWGIKHRTGFIIKNMIKEVRDNPRGVMAKKIKLAFENDESLKLKI